MNMTLDGFCDHDKMDADDEIHRHYTELLRDADLAIYGRKTFELMKFWQTLVANSSGNEAMDEFAVAMDDIHKIVYSRSLETTDWKTAELKRELVEDDIVELKTRMGGNIIVGSPSMIVQLANLGLVDEYQLAIHPTIAGGGLALFKDVNGRIDLRLVKTKTFGCGAVIHYYEPKKG